MDPDKALALDDAASEGKWFPYRDGSRVRVAYWDNPKFKKAIQRKLKAFGGFRNIPEEVDTKIICEAIGETILLDWEGFTRGGNPLPYSRETAIDLLMRLPVFRNDISSLARGEEEFMKQTEAEQEGNSFSS